MPAPPRTVWDDLADCLADTGHGRLNWIDQYVWDRHRDTAPTDPSLATWAQEVAAAERLLAETDGRYIAWPDCATQLGLRV